MRTIVHGSAVLWIVLGLSTAVQATTDCRQTIEFLARTRGSTPIFWIREDISGALNQSRLIQIIIAPTGRAVAGATLLAEFEDWEAIKKGIDRMSREQPIAMVKEKGDWKAPRSSWILQPPKDDPELLAAYRKHVYDGGSGAMTWYRQTGDRGILLPQIVDLPSELIYFHPRGLYINYEIDRAYFFPRSGYILVLTQQSEFAIGMDTMHGFLLFRLLPVQATTQPAEG